MAPPLVYFLLALLVGCTHATRYQSWKKNHGYRELPSHGSVRFVAFDANSLTPKETAELYAKYRAIELCFESGRPLTHILSVRDLSKSRQVVQSTTSGYPGYYYGMSPYYGRYNSGLGHVGGVWYHDQLDGDLYLPKLSSGLPLFR